MRLAIVAAAITLGLAAWLVVSDFADIPCQDGRWDSDRRTCVPY